MCRIFLQSYPTLNFLWLHQSHQEDSLAMNDASTSFSATKNELPLPGCWLAGRSKISQLLKFILLSRLKAVTERGGLQMRHHRKVVIFVLDHLIHLLNIITSMLCPGTIDLERKKPWISQTAPGMLTGVPFALVTWAKEGNKIFL